MVSDASLRKSSWIALKDLLKGNIGSYSTSSQPSVKGKLPDLEPSFPALILRPANVSKDDFTIDDVRSVSSKNIVFVLEIYAKKNEDIDLLSDDVDVLLTNNPISGLFLVGWEEDDGFVIPPNSKIKQKTITLNFKRR